MMHNDSSSKNNNSNLMLNSRHIDQPSVRIGDIVSPNNGIVQLTLLCLIVGSLIKCTRGKIIKIS